MSGPDARPGIANGIGAARDIDRQPVSRGVDEISRGIGERDIEARRTEFRHCGDDGVGREEKFFVGFFCAYFADIAPMSHADPA